MAEQVWFLRHGEAEPHDARPDAERRLTERGEAQSRAAGRALHAAGVTVHEVFTSPKVRARDTATLACEALARTPVEHAPLTAGFDREDVIELLHAYGPDRRLLLVGHNPDFAEAVHALTGARIEMKKGGIAGVRMTGRGAGELIVLLRPREIDRIA